MNLQYLYEIMANTIEVDGIGHWRVLPIYSNENPENYFGFVYCIENTKTKKLYIGRKQTIHKGKKSSKHYGKSTNWKNYTGSSKHLTEDIKKFGKSAFKFHILEYYKSRGGLNAAEIEWQVKCNVLTARFENSDERIFLNGQIAALRWVPKEFFTDEHRNKISEAMNKRIAEGNHPMIGIKHSDETKQKMSKNHSGFVPEPRYGEEHPMYGMVGEKSPVSRPIRVWKENKSYTFVSITEAAAELGLKRKSLNEVVSGRKKSLYGWRAEYL